jgi:hypothetical protein
MYFFCPLTGKGNMAALDDRTTRMYLRTLFASQRDLWKSLHVVSAALEALSKTNATNPEDTQKVLAEILQDVRDSLASDQSIQAIGLSLGYLEDSN